jgi:hypothetical protein
MIYRFTKELLLRFIPYCYNLKDFIASLNFHQLQQFTQSVYHF